MDTARPGESAVISKFTPKIWVLSLLVPFVIGFDQLTKLLILDRFRLGESLSILEGLFNLTYVRNTGAAFGFLAQANPAFRVPFFLTVPVIALLAIGYVFRKIADSDVRAASALSLVIGGAIGNLIDRLRLGFVVDFLDFHWKNGAHFPAFNIADSAICVGVALLMLDIQGGKPAHASITP